MQPNPPCARRPSTSSFTCSTVARNWSGRLRDGGAGAAIARKRQRFGEIDHQTVDVALEEPLEGVGRAERPVGGLAVVPRHVLGSHLREIRATS